MLSLLISLIKVLRQIFSQVDGRRLRGKLLQGQEQQDDQVKPDVSNDVIVRVIDKDKEQFARTEGDNYGVSGHIHSKDYIFWSTFDEMELDQDTGRKSAEAYMASGHKTASVIFDLVGTGPESAQPRILDFAAGYGRISRHLKTFYPASVITMSDIHPEALTFASELGCLSVPSTWRPSDFRPGQFDIVIAVSFFTHMPKDTWVAWLQALTDCLAPGGIMLFTTHGLPAMVPMGVSEVDSEGFIFHPHREQKDLNISKYASTTTLPEYVFPSLLKCGLDVIKFCEGGFGYQDYYLVTRHRVVRRSI